MLTVLTGSMGVTPGSRGSGMRSRGQEREGEGVCVGLENGEASGLLAGEGPLSWATIPRLGASLKIPGWPGTWQAVTGACPQVLSRPTGQAPERATAHCRLGACRTGEVTSPWAHQVTQGAITRPAKGALGTRRPVPAGRHVAVGMKGAIQEG